MTTSITRFSFTFAVASALLLTLSGCDRNDKIEGAVKDVFGGVLSDVSVSIEKSAFKAISGADGSYALDFAPGQFTVVFSRPGYTTHKLDLNLSQKVRFPAEEVRLYPIPSEPGVYLIDYKLNSLTALKKNSTVVLTEADAGLMATFVVFGLHIPSDQHPWPGLVLAAGKLEFIDTDLPERPRILNEVRDNDLVIDEQTRTPPVGKVHYRSLPKETSVRIGSDKLLVRTYTLTPGLYAFTPHFTAMSGDKIPVKNAQARAFEVK